MFDGRGVRLEACRSDDVRDLQETQDAAAQCLESANTAMPPEPDLKTTRDYEDLLLVNTTDPGALVRPMLHLRLVCHPEMAALCTYIV